MSTNQIENTMDSDLTDEQLEELTKPAEVAAEEQPLPVVTVKVPEVKVAPAITEIKAPVVEEFKPAPTTKTEDIITDLRQTGSASVRALISSLDTYISAMKPGKPLDGDKGAQYQFNLWRAISHICTSAPVDDFTKLWNVLLIFFEQHKNGVFNDRYVYRFSEYWIWKEEDLLAFQRVINLIKLTCNPAERAKGLKQVDFNRTLESGFSDEARQRIISFYR